MTTPGYHKAPWWDPKSFWRTTSFFVFLWLAIGQLALSVRVVPEVPDRRSLIMNKIANADAPAGMGVDENGKEDARFTGEKNAAEKEKETAGEKIEAILYNISNSSVHDLFHFILTSNHLDWKFVQALDRVFFHHPNADIILHSNTLPTKGHPHLDSYVQAGYNLQVRPFNMSQALRNATQSFGHETNRAKEDAEKFLQNLEEWKKRDPYWTNNESNLLRYLMVYLNGGIYLDMDMFMQRPIPTSIQNAVGYESKEGLLNNAALIFEPHHPYMKESILEFIQTYEKGVGNWAFFGPHMITRVYLRNEERKAAGHFQESYNVTTLPHKAFQPIPHRRAPKCYTNKTMTVDLSETYAVHLNNKKTKHISSPTEGTLCDKIFNTNCLLFCNHTLTRVQ